jgi:pyridoxal phosphate enzyme (YggS family)
MDRIVENLSQVRQRIAEAARRSGRSADDIKLVAVTKYVEASTVRALVGAGCRDLGESRPQELWIKAEELADLPVNWHLIGHLQRNKVERTLRLVSLIHSVDSLRLLTAINEAAAQSPCTPAVLLEVNISGDRSKHGFSPDEIGRSLPEIAAFDCVRVRGLMAMAGRDRDLESARRDFARLRQLRDRLSRDLPAGVSLDEMSMGMSGDFEVAIEERATIVRVGSALFKGVSE